MTDATPLASEQITPETFLAQLRRVNTDRYQAWIGDADDAGILFDAAELGGEVGELLNVVKKLEREARGWRGSRAAPEDFADECADVLICLDKLARRMDVDLEAATIRKFNATSDKVGLPQRLSATPVPGDQDASQAQGERLREVIYRYQCDAGLAPDDAAADADGIVEAYLAAPGATAQDGELTADERRLEDLKQMAAYAGPIVSFDLREPYYLASCDRCGWVGSSELCGTDSWGDDSDVYCPRCHASGADCGKVAERIAIPTPTIPADMVADLCRERFVEPNDDWDKGWNAALESLLAAAPKQAEQMTAQEWMRQKYDDAGFPGTYTFYDYSSADMLAAFIAGESCGQTTMAMDAAPKDGTMLRLLVDYTDGGGPLDDALTAWTIGFNDLVNTGVDEWKFAGWCWTHDHFSQGSGTPVGWLPWSNPSTGGDEQ